MVAIVIGATYALQAIKPEWFLIGTPPTHEYLAVNISYNLLAALTGGYLAARIAGRAPLRHAVALAALSVGMTIVSVLAADQEQPRWYRVFLVVVIPAVIVAGGWLRGRGRAAEPLAA
jgi:hypothetical protein